MSPSPRAGPPRASQFIVRLLGDDMSEEGRGPRVDRRIGLAVLAFVIFTMAVVVMSALPLLRLWSRPTPELAAARKDDPLLEEFDRSLAGDLAQVSGRSLFALPQPPSPKRDTAKKPATTPTRYGGPAIVAMVNDQVWFNERVDGKDLRLGPGDPVQRGLKVVSIDAPWSAKIEWEGAEFTVEFFQRSPLLATNDTRGEPGVRIVPNPNVPGGGLSPTVEKRPLPPRAADSAGGVPTSETPHPPPAPPETGGGSPPPQPPPSEPASGGHPPTSSPPAGEPQPTTPPSNTPPTPPAEPPSEPENRPS